MKTPVNTNFGTSLLFKSELIYSTGHLFGLILSNFANDIFVFIYYRFT